jgi:hypothetical protein
VLDGFSGGEEGQDVLDGMDPLVTKSPAAPDKGTTHIWTFCISVLQFDIC